MTSNQPGDQWPTLLEEAKSAAQSAKISSNLASKCKEIKRNKFNVIKLLQIRQKISQKKKKQLLGEWWFILLSILIVGLLVRLTLTQEIAAMFSFFVGILLKDILSRN